jgi:molybdate transport system substrate-binding protein
VLAGNTLVLVVPRNSKLRLHRFQDVVASSITHVAIGAPSVPAGIRAQEVFTKLGIWRQIERKAVRGKDVREVLTQVELGNVEAGVVYRTDAAISQRVRVVAVASPSLHQPIRYPLAVVADSEHKIEARMFANYLVGAQAKAVLKKFKFVVR